MNIPESDLRVELFGDSNYTRTGVRITHIPTGEVVEADAHASAFKNRKAAMAELGRRLDKQDQDFAHELGYEEGAKMARDRVRAVLNEPETRLKVAQAISESLVYARGVTDFTDATDAMDAAIEVIAQRLGIRLDDAHEPDGDL